MKILITGGAGYIGYSLVKQLLEDVEQLHSITIYDNLSRRNYSFFTEAKFDHKPIKFIHGDILDGRQLGQALQGIDCVIHLAAKVTTPFADADAHSFDQINHWGTHNSHTRSSNPRYQKSFISAVFQFMETAANPSTS
jgi:UDP-glucose 4-epimerase